VQTRHYWRQGEKRLLVGMNGWTGETLSGGNAPRPWSRCCALTGVVQVAQHRLGRRKTVLGTGRG